MIPAQKPCKSFIRHKKDFSLVAEIMERYLDKWNVPRGKSTKEFAEKYFESMIEKTLSGEERVVLPHNLGYLQVLEHKCAIHEKDFGEKNNGLDWSLIWVRHPMFVHHRIKMGKYLLIFLQNYISILDVNEVQPHLS